MPPEDAKRALRERRRAAAVAWTPGARAAASEALAGRVLSWPPVAAARCVLAFLSMDDEPDTAPLIAGLLGRGVRVTAPGIGWEDRTLTPTLLTDPARDTAVDARGVPQPREGLPTVGLEEVDVVFVPGMAFDLRGFRLGRGMGFYDRLLARADRRGIALGLAVEAQLVHRVPAEPHDRRLDALATERRVLEINAARVATVADKLASRPHPKPDGSGEGAGEDAGR